LRYFHHRAEPVQFTRSRSYHKNDQAHVEQTSVSSVEPKQWTHVFASGGLLGCDRLEDRRLVALIDDLYRNEWRALQTSVSSVEPNFFLPTMRLLSKTRDGGHLHRRHSKPATPYQKNAPQRHRDAEKCTSRRFCTAIHDFLFFERGFRGSESRLSV